MFLRPLKAWVRGGWEVSRKRAANGRGGDHGHVLMPLPQAQSMASGPSASPLTQTKCQVAYKRASKPCPSTPQSCTLKHNPPRAAKSNYVPQLASSCWCCLAPSLWCMPWWYHTYVSTLCLSTNMRRAYIQDSHGLPTNSTTANRHLRRLAPSPSSSSRLTARLPRTSVPRSSTIEVRRRQSQFRSSPRSVQLD